MPQVQWLRYSDLPSGDESLVVAQAPVVFVMPWIDERRARGAADILCRRAGADFLLLAVQDDLRAGPVAVWNRVFARTGGALFGYLADDAFPGRGWLRVALDALQGRPGSQLLAFNDGKWFGQLAAFGLARRAWLEGLYGSNLFHPAYHQHFGDTELSLIARQQQALVYEPHAVLVEIDAEKDGREVHAADRALFHERARHGFDGRVTHPGLLRLFA